MTLHLRAEEPSGAPWQIVSIAFLARVLTQDLVNTAGRPMIIAVDGRSGSGKSTLATALHRHVDRSIVVHTDDIAWHHSFFDWMALLGQSILIPVHAGKAVTYRPEAWIERGREGAIEVPSGLSLLLLEGVGAGHKALAPWVDAMIWVQSDQHAARTRGIARDGGHDEAQRFWDAWEAEEIPFLAAQKPWDRAKVIALGTPLITLDSSSQVVISSRSVP